MQGSMRSRIAKIDTGSLYQYHADGGAFNLRIGNNFATVE
jgi:hypothetical protein